MKEKFTSIGKEKIVMRNFLHSSSASTSVLYPWPQQDSKHQSSASSLVFSSHPNFLHTISTTLNLQRVSSRPCLNPLSISDGNGGLVLGSNKKEEEDDDAELCPVDCVKEFKTDEEFLDILEKSKETGALVVVDFFRPSCGSCKYVEQGFMKLCKGSGDQDSDVVFLKHNVIDEYDEQSEVADRLRIKIVPLFHFYKNGVLLEAFPTRDKEKIMEAIRKYTSAS